MRRKQLTLSQKVFIVKNYYQRSDMDEVQQAFEKLFRIKSKNDILEIFFKLVSEFERTGQVTQQVFYEGTSLTIPDEGKTPQGQSEGPKKRGRKPILKLEEHNVIEDEFVEDEAAATSSPLTDPTEGPPPAEEAPKVWTLKIEAPMIPQSTTEVIQAVDPTDGAYTEIEYMYLPDETDLIDEHVSVAGDEGSVEINEDETEIMDFKTDADESNTDCEYLAPEKKRRPRIPPSSDREDCVVCGRNYSQKLINSHMRKHDREGHIYKCQDCDSEFKNYQALRIHSESHIPVSKYKFQCTICQVKFVSQDRLNLHQKDHVQKTFICERCGMIFAKPDALKLHTRTHTGEKPMKCVECDQSFAFYGSLKSHMKKHSTGTYKCNYCDQVFIYKVERNLHHRTHIGAKPYICHICNRGCAAAHNLRSHLKLLHKVEMSLEEIQTNNYEGSLDPQSVY